jgi:arylformamidase
MPKYPTDPDIVIRPYKSFEKGNSCNLSEISFGTHTGTHVDAPAHLFDGALTVDRIDPELMFMDVLVAYPADIASITGGKDAVKGILLKKKGGTAALDENGAERLIKRGMRLVGTENTSIEDGTDKYHPVHRMLLKKGVVILENLDLSKAAPGVYGLIWMPLRIKDGDGAPVRAVLRK